MQDVLVLAYHALSRDWPAALSIPPERFEHQVRLLADSGYQSVTFTQAVSEPRPDKTVAITFDDGFRSVFEHALPILNRQGFVATVFVPTSYMGQPGPAAWPNVNRWIDGPYEAELATMSWSELAILASAGWEVGSHTCGHPRLTALDDERRRRELVESRRACERQLGLTCTSLAYPYGAVDRWVMAAARQAGYTAAAALPSRIHRPHPLRWPRVGVWHNDREHHFLTKLSPIRRRRLAMPAGRLRPLPRWRF